MKAEQSASSVLVETRCDGKIGVIAINRSSHRNALNIDVKTRIADAVASISGEDAVRVIVLTGSPAYFAAGTDIAEMVDMTPSDHMRLGTDRVFTVLRRCPKILIAAVEGFALGGGCELALCCDLIVAGEGAKFGQPEIRVGIMPGGGATQRLVRVMGRYRAMKILLTGEPVAAPDALALGMISDVVPDGTSLAAALKLATQILAMPPLAVYAIKEVVNAGQDTPLETALLLERKAFTLLFDSADQKEGMRAFLEKRSPRYTGRF